MVAHENLKKTTKVKHLLVIYMLHHVVPLAKNGTQIMQEEERTEDVGPATKQYNENRQRYSIKSTLWKLAEPIASQEKLERVFTRKDILRDS